MATMLPFLTMDNGEIPKTQKVKNVLLLYKYTATLKLFTALKCQGVSVIIRITRQAAVINETIFTLATKYAIRVWYNLINKL